MGPSATKLLPATRVPPLPPTAMPHAAVSEAASRLVVPDGRERSAEDEAEDRRRDAAQKEREALTLNLDVADAVVAAARVAAAAFPLAKVRCATPLSAILACRSSVGLGSRPPRVTLGPRLHAAGRPATAESIYVRLALRSARALNLRQSPGCFFLFRFVSL